ncbi:hypothetical protein Vi05172_g8966 [Venturia inaequalis]|nr:hypothetical protein Vi05172_g8966 [Venturia inaequalis]
MGAGGMFPPNMETFDGTAAHLEGHKMAIQIPASPASEL